jgi:metabotropic glutamate receptor 2/3
MYDIMNYRNQDGVNKYVRVASWDGESVNGKMKSKLVIFENITWLQGVSHPPTSYCSRKCDIQDEVFVQAPPLDFKCCWLCKQCHKLQIVQNNTCIDGPLGWLPNTNRTGWVKRELIYPKWNDRLSIALTVLSLISLVLTLCTFAFYIKYKQNRLLKASGRELCFVMLTGITLSFVVPILFIAKPGRYVCNAQSLVTALSLVMCYAPLFMKVNRTYRIFTAARSSAACPPFVSPRMQLLITFALISIQLLLSIFLSFVNPTKAKEHYASHSEELFLECYIEDHGFTVNLSYVMLLMFLCTVYAFKTRNFPRNYNESKFIGTTMYATCAVWTVFFTLYFNTDHGAQHSYLFSAAYLVIGLITLLGLFGQKVFIVLCVKDLTEENLSMSTRTRCSIVPQHKDDQI